jgi:hypothetical protein
VKTHRTSIGRALEDARHARSFSMAGGSSGAALPFAAIVNDDSDDEKQWPFGYRSTVRIAYCGALSERRGVVKRFVGACKRIQGCAQTIVSTSAKRWHDRRDTDSTSRLTQTSG